MHVQSNGGWLGGWQGGWLAGWRCPAVRPKPPPPWLAQLPGTHRCSPTQGSSRTPRTTSSVWGNIWEHVGGTCGNIFHFTLKTCFLEVPDILNGLSTLKNPFYQQKRRG